MDDTLLVAIAGGTASGKTTIAKRVAELLGEECLLISHDRYYVDVAHPETFNYDHPRALDTARLVENLRDLLAGDPTELPDYDFPTHTRKAVGERVQPRSVVICEGILILEDEALRDLMHLKVWVETPDDLRLVRRIRRDVADRGRSLDMVLNRWLSTVRPMHHRHVQPTAAFADMQVRGVGLIEPLVDSVLAAIERRRLDIRSEMGSFDNPFDESADTCSHLFSELTTLDEDDLEPLD